MPNDAWWALEPRALEEESNLAPAVVCIREVTLADCKAVAAIVEEKLLMREATVLALPPMRFASSFVVDCMMYRSSGCSNYGIVTNVEDEMLPTVICVLQSNVECSL